MSSVDAEGKAKILAVFVPVEIGDSSEARSALAAPTLTATAATQKTDITVSASSILIVMLAGADLAGTDLRWTDLSEANLAQRPISANAI